MKLKHGAYACIHHYVRLSKAQEEALLKLDYIKWMTHEESGIHGTTLYALVRKGIVEKYCRSWISQPIVFRIASNISIMKCRKECDDETI